MFTYLSISLLAKLAYMCVCIYILYINIDIRPWNGRNHAVSFHRAGRPGQPLNPAEVCLDAFARDDFLLG